MLLPEIRTIQNDSDLAVKLSLHIPGTLDYFPDHFPNLPILPGVVQLNWAIHYAREFLPVTGSFVSMENIKFQSIVLPNADMDLSLQWIVDKSHLEFLFFRNQQKFSSGRIVFSGSNA